MAWVFVERVFRIAFALVMKILEAFPPVDLSCCRAIPCGET